jgi:hypothetical protein
LNKAYSFKNLIPELVEKKEPPIITNIKNINERFCGESSREKPILEILLVKDKKITLKLYSELKNKKNKKINVTRYMSKYISSWKKLIFLFLIKNKL